MREQLLELKSRALAQLESSGSMDELNELKLKFMGKKGELTQVLKSMGKLSAEERPIMGQLANEIRDELDSRIAKAAEGLKAKEYQLRIKAEAFQFQ